MPGSFDKEMMIEHGCLKPSGPLGLADGERVLRLDFWILQDGAACMGFLPGPQGEMDEVPPGRWTITQDLRANHFGKEFETGAAIGMGLMVKQNAKGEKIVEQWDRPINLV
jgi:hypothetical protein